MTRFILMMVIFLTFLGFNIYVRLITLKFYKQLVQNRIDFTFTDIFNSQKWEDNVVSKHELHRGLLTQFRKHILITGALFISTIVIVLLSLYALRNTI